MNLHKDSKEFIELLNSNDVRFVIAGAHALAYHGHPRSTGDLDIFIETSPENAAKMETVVAQFGFEDTGLKAVDFLGDDHVIQLGLPPNRIDILTILTGLTFEDVWDGRIEANLDGLSVNILSRDDLIANKKALGRPKDIADLEALEP